MEEILHQLCELHLMTVALGVRIIPNSVAFAVNCSSIQILVFRKGLGE